MNPQEADEQISIFEAIADDYTTARTDKGHIDVMDGERDGTSPEVGTAQSRTQSKARSQYQGRARISQRNGSSTGKTVYGSDGASAGSATHSQKMSRNSQCLNQFYLIVRKTVCPSDGLKRKHFKTMANRHSQVLTRVTRTINRPVPICAVHHGYEIRTMRQALDLIKQRLKACRLPREMIELHLQEVTKWRQAPAQGHQAHQAKRTSTARFTLGKEKVTEQPYYQKRHMCSICRWPSLTCNLIC
jgi:hypothetical protein